MKIFSDYIKNNKLLLIVVLFLILSNIASLVYVFNIKKNKDLVDNNPYPLVDISRNFISQEHFIGTLQPVREYLQKLVQEEGSDSISIYVEYLNTGANISINQDLRIFPASLVKVPLAMAVMKKVEKGDWFLQNELVVMPEDRDYGWGDVHKYPIGTRLTIEELIEEMLLNSDNTAYRMLYRNLSFDELQDVIVTLGLEDLFSEDGKITAKEYTRLFRSLYVSNYLSQDNSQKLLEILSKTSYDKYLGQGMPKDVIFAHKIGENQDMKVILDAGIVYVENRPYLVSAMIDYKDMGLDKAKAILKDISEKIYVYVADYGRS